MAFYYGEILWTVAELGKGSWKDAAEQYTKVVELNPKGKYVKESAYASVLAWKNALNVDDHEQKEAVEKDRQAFNSKKGGKLEALTIPEYQKKMIDAFETYVKYVPDAPERVVIMYREARIYYEYNHFDDAAKRFEVIVDKYPKHELAIYSANLLLDSLNAQGKTKEVVSYVDKFLEMPDLMKDPEFGKQMISLKSDTFDIEGHEYEKQKNFKECARSFQAAAEAMPDHPKHAERRWNEAQCFQNAHLVGQALRARVALISEHPKDPLAQRALFRVAAGYHQLAFYTKAADSYEEFANKFPGEKKAVDALGNATTFRIGLGESSKALDDMDAFVKFYGTRKPQDAAGVFFQMADVYERDKKYDELAKHLESYLKKWGPQGGPDRQVLAHFRLGELAWKASCPKANEDGACLEIKRIAATGRQKVLYDLNKKRKKGQKILHEAKRTQCGPPTSSKIVLFDREQEGRVQGRGALPGRAEDLEQGRCRVEDHRQGRRGARRLGAVRGRGLGVLSRRDGVRELPARQVPGGSRLPAAEPVRQQAQGRGEEEEGRGVGQAVRRLSRREGQGAQQGERHVPGRLRHEAGAVDDRVERAHRPAVLGLRRPALHRHDSGRPERAGRVG